WEFPTSAAELWDFPTVATAAKSSRCSAILPVLRFEKPAGCHGLVNVDVQSHERLGSDLLISVLYARLPPDTGEHLLVVTALVAKVVSDDSSQKLGAVGGVGVLAATEVECVVVFARQLHEVALRYVEGWGPVPHLLPERFHALPSGIFRPRASLQRL